MPVRSEAPLPMAKRVGIMQPQHLDISSQQARTFNCRHHLAERRAIGAREDVFANPGIGRIVADLSGIGSALAINLTVPQPSSDTDRTFDLSCARVSRRAIAMTSLRG